MDRTTDLEGSSRHGGGQNAMNGWSHRRQEGEETTGAVELGCDWLAAIAVPHHGSGGVTFGGSVLGTVVVGISDGGRSK